MSWSSYIPEPWRTKYFLNHKVGDQIFYDAPDYAHSYAMRVDSFPADGEFAGSDPDMAFKQLIMEAGSDIGILEPTHGEMRLPEATSAFCTATNLWLANHWLDSHNNWHERWRGSICVAIEDAPGTVREIETWAEHPYMSQILIKAEPRPSWGDPIYDPVWAASCKHDIPISCHLSRGQFETLPAPPVGFPSYNHDFMVTYSLLAANQVMSLIFDGVFDRFPELRIVFIEHAFTWILPLMWRMDAIYEARKSWMDIKRKPSEYVKEHIKFTTQPLDYPEDKTELIAGVRVDGVRQDPALQHRTTRTGPSTTHAGWSSTCPSMPARTSCSATASRPTRSPGDGAGPRGPGPCLLDRCAGAERLGMEIDSDRTETAPPGAGA